MQRSRAIENMEINICVFSPVLVNKSEGEIDDDEKKLLNFVFSRYDAELRPVLNKRDTVRVKFGISLHQIIEVVSKLLDFLKVFST